MPDILIRRIRNHLVNVAGALLLLTACATTPANVAQQPTPTIAATPPASTPTPVAATEAPTAAPPPTATTAPTAPATATPAAQAPTATAEAASEFAPIVDVTGHYLLGGVQSTNWLTTEQAFSLVRGGEAYRIVASGQITGTEQGSAVRAGEVPCDWLHEIDVQGTSRTPQQVPLVAKRGTLAVGGNWELFPRQLQELGTSQQVYRDAVAAMLAEHGIAKPNVQIGRIVRADLDGDGSDEVVLNATYYKGMSEEGYISSNAAAGDYSLVLLRMVVNGKVVTVPIAEEYYTEDKEFSAPQEHVLADVLDLNGDGRLDLVVRSSYYEGASTTVFDIVGTTATAVLSEGCGV